MSFIYFIIKFEDGLDFKFFVVYLYCYEFLLGLVVFRKLVINDIIIVKR